MAREAAGKIAADKALYNIGARLAWIAKRRIPFAKAAASCGCLSGRVVPTEGLEPPHLAAHGPEPCASTNSATWAIRKESDYSGKRITESIQGGTETQP